MKWRISLVVLAVAAMGCKSNPVSHVHSSGLHLPVPVPICDTSVHAEDCVAPVACPPPVPNITINMPKELRLKTDAAEKPAEPSGQPASETSGVAAVTRETLLVPRMVYVPYAPQVPVAPARMIHTAPAGQVSRVAANGAAGTTTAGNQAACPPQVTADQFLALADAVETLARRVNEISTQPTIIPSTEKAICPPPSSSIPRSR